MKRCPWAESTESMKQYHDHVWGVPEYDDQKLFRKLMLDINQAGLSWQTILNKEAAFDLAYDGFAIDKVAAYDQNKVEELLTNPGIIRNRRKIEAAIVNAQAVQKIQAEYTSFSDYLWSFTGHQPLNNRYEEQSKIPTTNELSDKLTKDLKKEALNLSEARQSMLF